MEVKPHVDDVLERYGMEVAVLTQRAILAEARADAAMKALEEAQAALAEPQPQTEEAPHA